MEAFSISDTAFTGFRIVRARPKAVVALAGVQFIAMLVITGVLVATAGPTLMRLREMGALAATDTAATMALLQQMAPGYGLFIVSALVFDALVYAAMNRAVMRPDDDRFGYFRLGVEEMRQFGLLLLSFAVFMGAYFVSFLIAIVIAVAVSSASKAVAGLAAVLTVVAAICAVIFGAVRLSLASAQTFATGRINLFGSWALTRGRFWAILGAYVLVLALAGVVLVVGFVLTFALMTIVGGKDGMAAMMDSNLASLAAFFTPLRLAKAVVSAVIWGLVLPVILTPPAAIYLRLVGGPAPATGI
jgi:hypothetical protein